MARIARGLEDCLYLGNIDAKRDWGHARDYVEGMWRMLQADKPDDFVLATNETHTVRSFVELAFKEVGMTITWQGAHRHAWTRSASTRTARWWCASTRATSAPPRSTSSSGDSSKAERVLGWKATTPLHQLVKEMVEGDLKQCEEKNLKW